MTFTKPWAFFTKRVIPDQEGNPYLIRWIIFRCNWFSIYVHKILKSDQDRHLHDHPWSFLSFIFSGSYVETAYRSFRAKVTDVTTTGGVKLGEDGEIHTFDNHIYIPNDEIEITGLADKEYRAPALNFKRAEDAHRLELPKGPVWSLVLCGPRRRLWGFHTEEGWKPYNEYLDEKFGKGNWEQAE